MSLRDLTSNLHTILNPLQENTRGTQNVILGILKEKHKGFADMEGSRLIEELVKLQNEVEKRQGIVTSEDTINLMEHHQELAGRMNIALPSNQPALVNHQYVSDVQIALRELTSNLRMILRPSKINPNSFHNSILRELKEKYQKDPHAKVILGILEEMARVQDKIEAQEGSPTFGDFIEATYLNVKEFIWNERVDTESIHETPQCVSDVKNALLIIQRNIDAKRGSYEYGLKFP
ncbi:hypothetical protein PtA15_13A51 [Puccinia triticina]|uniref:Uncharacterized protein n=1 Tax=Puccinia triticina TaxID=208348 RepID=A0ABY7D1S9_9BASI|nr:uncharacterized protein PtA15_13A51 [Puccinia triticina]WAQ90652.1 hypothetical protein PtA15_13A51 [Puccinia triticina]